MDSSICSERSKDVINIEPYFMMAPLMFKILGRVITAFIRHLVDGIRWLNGRRWETLAWGKLKRGVDVGIEDWSGESIVDKALLCLHVEQTKTLAL